MSAGINFRYPQQELQQELDASRRKAQVLEDTLRDLLEELQFIHRQAEQLQDQRGQVIHNALGDLIEEMEYTKNQINTLQNSLDDATARAFQQDSGQHLRELLVRLMTLALRHWEEVTGYTKLELAEQSGIWALHEDKGYLRVRTLDRYLSVPTLPRLAAVRQGDDPCGLQFACCGIEFIPGGGHLQSVGVQYLLVGPEPVDAVDVHRCRAVLGETVALHVICDLRAEQ